MSEDLWSLPSSWSWAKIEDVGRVVSGGTPSTKEPSYWGDDVVWYSPADLTGFKAKYISRGAKSLSKKGLTNSSAQLMPKGTVMFSSRAPIGYVAITSTEAATNQGFKSVAPGVGISSEYLFYYLKAAKHLAEERATGTTFKEISGSAFAKLPIPIAPSSEQVRIVTKIEELLSELDKAIESLTAAREQLKAYRQSILKHAFEGKLTKAWRNAHPKAARRLLADIQTEREARKLKKMICPEAGQRDQSLVPVVPEGWVTDYLGNLNVEIFDGPFGSHLKTSDYVETGVRVIRLENIGRGKFIDDNCSFVSEKKYIDIQKHTVVPGDIVFSSFVTEAIRSTLVPMHIRFAVNKADCFAIRVLGKAVSAKFVQLFLQSRNAFKQVEGMIHGVGRPRINTSQLKEIIIPLCPLAEQKLVIETVETILSGTESFESAIEMGLTQISAFRQSILKQAFSGQLVAQDARDEPASVLLERIRAERENGSAKKRRNNKSNKKEAA